MQVPPISPTVLQQIPTYQDPYGIFCITSQWQGGRTLWCKRVTPDEPYITIVDRLCLANAKIPIGGAPVRLKNRSRVPASEFWVSWDRASLQTLLGPNPSRRTSAPI